MSKANIQVISDSRQARVVVIRNGEAINLAVITRGQFETTSHIDAANWLAGSPESLWMPLLQDALVNSFGALVIYRYIDRMLQHVTPEVTAKMILGESL
jgi:hypothetical protein